MFRKCCKRCYCKNKSNQCCKRNCNNLEKQEFEITMEQLFQMKLEGAIILDIRSPQEYKEGHINGAIVLPEYEIRKNASKVLPNKNQTIVVYCGTGIRSRNAMITLQRLGYTNVYNLYKGTENY